MRSLAHAIVRSLESGQALELVTVLTASGSTPRGPGAMLAVFSDGTAVGTVGGGNVEFEATAVAKSLLQSQQDALREFRLIQGDAASLGMVCGGDLTLHFQYLSADDASTLALFRELLEATGQNRDVWLVRRLDNEKVSAMDLADRDGPRHLPGLPLDLLGNAPALRDGWFTLPAVRAGLLYIFGGGHVSQALVPVAATVGFRPFIYDDRPEFAAKARFPQAADTLCGSQRPPTAQWTATASGCTILAREGEGPYITHITCGKIVDKGVTDANNMGAAMAPAAYDSLAAFFRDTGTGPRDYDLVITGDLGELGHAIVRDFFAKDGIDMGENFQDCGLLLYDRDKQDMHAGASGCGCSASVLNGYLLTEMRRGKWKNILFAPTGALLSPTSSFQGESVPGICHVVQISMKK